MSTYDSTATDGIGQPIKIGDIVAYSEDRRSGWWTGEIKQIEPTIYGFRALIINKIDTNAYWEQYLKKKGEERKPYKEVWVSYRSFVKVPQHVSIKY